MRSLCITQLKASQYSFQYFMFHSSPTSSFFHTENQPLRTPHTIHVRLEHAIIMGSQHDSFCANRFRNIIPNHAQSPTLTISLTPFQQILFAEVRITRPTTRIHQTQTLNQTATTHSYFPPFKVSSSTQKTRNQQKPFPTQASDRQPFPSKFSFDY